MYDELTRVNNDLSNLQRELFRKNMKFMLRLINDLLDVGCVTTTLRFSFISRIRPHQRKEHKCVCLWMQAKIKGEAPYGKEGGV